jgi:hypothetical protein
LMNWPWTLNSFIHRLSSSYDSSWSNWRSRRPHWTVEGSDILQIHPSYENSGWKSFKAYRHTDGESLPEES